MDSAKCPFSANTLLRNLQFFTFQVKLHGSFSVDAISLQLGELSSQIESIELISDDHVINRCPLGDDFKQRVSSSSSSSANFNASHTFFCKAKNISSVRLRTMARLHLCYFRVYSTKAGISNFNAIFMPSTNFTIIPPHHAYFPSSV